MEAARPVTSRAPSALGAILVFASVALLAFTILAKRLQAQGGDPHGVALLTIIGAFGLVSTIAILRASTRAALAVLVLVAIALNLVIAMSGPPDVLWNAWAYYWISGTQAVVDTGHLAIGQGIYPMDSYSAYPTALILYATVSLVTGLPADAIYRYLLPVAYPLAALLLFYVVLRAGLGFTGRVSLVGAAMLNGAFMFHNNFTVPYEAVAKASLLTLLATAAVNAGASRLAPVALVLLAAAAVVVGHHLTSYLLLATVLAILVARGFGSGGLGRLGQPTFALLLGVLVMAWLMNIAFAFLIRGSGALEALVHSMLNPFASPEKEIPFATTGFPLWQRLLANAGKALVLGLAVVGSVLAARRKEERIFTALGVLGLGIYLFFVVSLSVVTSDSVNISDLRFRTQEFAYFLMIPAALVGLSRGWTHARPILSRVVRGDRILGARAAALPPTWAVAVMLLVLCFGAVASYNPGSLAPREVQLASDNEYAPRAWHGLGVWGAREIPCDAQVGGTYKVSYVASLSLCHVVKWEHPLHPGPETTLAEPRYVVVASGNERFPDPYWRQTPLLRPDEMEVLDAGGSSIYHGGEIRVLVLPAADASAPAAAPDHSGR